MADSLIWLKRAKSNLIIAKRIVRDEYEVLGGEIFLEELCFELQQCAEKALKALLIHNNIIFPKTHNIAKLIQLLKDNNFNISEKIVDAVILTQYAVETRYPEDYEKIDEIEYQEALNIAENVYNWVKDQISQ
jgi:HEPN domain-containing protein